MENNKQEESKISTPAAIVVMGILIMLGIIISRTPGKTLKTNTNNINDNQANQVVKIALPSPADHILGNTSKAQAVIVEYSDTECPYCKVFNQMVIEAMKKYPDQIVLVYRHFPLETLHSKARNEALATECVNKLKGNDAFWQYLNIIFAKTPSNDGLDPNLLVTFASQVGIKSADFNSCMKNDQVELNKIIDASLAEGKNVGIKGTPYSVVITKDNVQLPVIGADQNSLDAALETAFMR